MIHRAFNAGGLRISDAALIALILPLSAAPALGALGGLGGWAPGGKWRRAVVGR